MISGKGIFILVMNLGTMKCVSIHTADSRPVIQFDVDTLGDGLRQEVKWTLAFHYQLVTHSALDFDRIHHHPHSLLLKTDTYCLPEGNQ
jgi:hypothetical protein